MKRVLLLSVLSLVPAWVPRSAKCITCDPGKCYGHCSGKCVCFQPNGSSRPGQCVVIEDRKFFQAN